MFQRESQNYNHPHYFTQSHEIYGESQTVKKENKQGKIQNFFVALFS